MAGRPPRCDISWRSVISPLPAAANSRHRRVEVQEAELHDPQHAGGGDRLADREEVDQRVGGPRAGAGAIGPAAPKIGHLAAADEDRHRRADLAVLREIGGERLAHRREARIALAPDWDGRLVAHADSLVCYPAARGKRLLPGGAASDERERRGLTRARPSGSARAMSKDGVAGEVVAVCRS